MKAFDVIEITQYSDCILTLHFFHAERLSMPNNTLRKARRNFGLENGKGCQQFLFVYAIIILTLTDRPTVTKPVVAQ